MATERIIDPKAVDPNFDPEKHSLADVKYFEDLEIGEEYPIPSRTLDDGNFVAFQACSLDNHPIHYDLEYCNRQGHPDLLAHGMHVLVQSVAGAGMFPHVVGEAMIAFIEQSSRFLRPVYRGDTVYPNLVIKELVSGRSTGTVTMRSTVHNQHRELVMEGEQKYLVRKRETSV
jgi:acyl dehydratase